MTPSPICARKRFVKRAPRQNLAISVEIQGPTVEPFETVTSNISTSGMLLADGGQLQVGDVFHARLSGASWQLCKVVRLKKDSGAGVEFVRSGIADC
ncbi:PilZ domain-containing protein [Sphingomonas sp. 37zxx]|uniref:PilZ domain-containing protein n=1 Tax=Sphingomonas sp. 37zxx TaxID=1550073 RepID=UPI0009DF1B32